MLSAFSAGDRTNIKYLIEKVEDDSRGKWFYFCSVM